MSSSGANGVDVDKMSVSQLKQYISAAGLSYADCLEKSDLRLRAARAKDVFAAREAAAGGGGSGARRRSIGGFDCLLVGPESDCDLVVVLMHGFGATNDDFADLPEALAQSSAALARLRALYVFPQAPTGAMGVPEWWSIDVQRWMMLRFSNDAGALRVLAEETPPGLEAARERLERLAVEACGLAGVAPERAAIGGFSQGAMTALDVVLNAESGFESAFMISGAPIALEQWPATFARRGEAFARGLRVFTSHGTRDEVLPYAGAELCRRLLEERGVAVEHVSHGGSHTVGPEPVLEGLAAFLAAAAGEGAGQA